MCDTCRAGKVWDSDTHGSPVLVPCPDCTPAGWMPEPEPMTAAEAMRQAYLWDLARRPRDEMREFYD